MRRGGGEKETVGGNHTTMGMKNGLCTERGEKRTVGKWTRGWG